MFGPMGGVSVGFRIHIEGTCLKCGRDRSEDMDEAFGQCERVVSDANDGTLAIEHPSKCPQCGSRRMRVAVRIR